MRHERHFRCLGDAWTLATLVAALPVCYGRNRAHRGRRRVIALLLSLSDAAADAGPTRPERDHALTLHAHCSEMRCLRRSAQDVPLADLIRESRLRLTVEERGLGDY